MSDIEQERNAKIPFLLTGHDRLGPPDDDSAGKTGFHLAEAVRPGPH